MPRTLDDLLHDLRFALRTLRRSPVFTASAVLILAIGIGATTVIGSVVDQILLRPLPYPDPGRLVVVRESIKEIADKYPVLSANASHYAEWQRGCKRCAEIGAARAVTLTLTTSSGPIELSAIRASASLLTLLGVQPFHGRLFSSQEDENGERLAVLGYQFWQRQLNGDPSAVGKTITVDGAPVTVIGILSSDFYFPKRNELGNLGTLPDQADLIVPLSLTPTERTARGTFDYTVIARLARGATTPQLVSELQTLQRAVAERAGVKMTLSTVVSGLQEQIVGEARGPLAMLFVAVVAVLLIVWTNLANLLLARNVDREQEAAVRVALGAGRRRLVRQALTESIVLAALGGALGLAFSLGGLSSLLRLAPADVPRLGEVQLNARVLLMGIGASLLTGVAFGLIPALRFGASDPGSMLRGGGRTATASRRHARHRDILVGAQVAISAVLLATTGLLLVSLARVLDVDRGFSASSLLAIDVNLPQARYDTPGRRADVYDEALTRLRGLPGVTGSAMTTGVPLEGDTQVDILSLENDTRPEVERPVANIVRVAPTYASTIGLRLIRGRLFEDRDRGRPVVILSERAARAAWPNEDPIGRRIEPGSNDPIAEVIGVVSDVRTTRLEEEGSAIAYLPHWMNAPTKGTILVRTNGDAAALTNAVRGVLRDVAPTAPLSRVRTIEGIVDAATAQRRFQLLLIGFFGVVALVTAAVGMYAMISYSLSRRSREIAIRMAVGARGADVYRLAFREGLMPVIAGLVVGIAGSIVAGRAVAALLYRASPGDPVIVSAVIFIIVAISVAACYVPARRAVATGTAEALRMS